MEQTASMLKAENTRLMQERDALIVDLQERDAELWKRMPPNQISEPSIKEAFKQIRSSIDGFVFDIMRDEVADDALLLLCQKEQRSQKQQTGKLRISLSEFIRNADLSAWGPYECSNLYILSVIIQWIIDEFIFSESYPMGITNEQIQVMEEVEEGMRKTHRGGKADTWRSETLTALTVLPGNDTLLERASRSICNDLSDFLSPWLLEAGPFAKVEESFRREILDPAIRLHQDLRSSCYRYDTKLITDIGRLSPKQMLEEWELKDADTWLKPRGENAVGKALYCLHPPILRLRDQGPPIVLVKAVMVVASPERERISNPQGIKGKVQRGTTAPPATTGSSTATSQTMSPRSTQHSSNQKKTSTRQSSGGSKRDQDVRPSNRGHRMEGTSKGSVPKVAPHQPSKRDSRDTSKDESSSRNSASKFSQPPLDPSSPGPSKPSAKHRSSKT